MSVIYIVNHNEVIYDVIDTRKKIIKPPPRYETYFDLEQLKNARKGKQACAILGPPEYPPADPSNYLRKNPMKIYKGKIPTFDNIHSYIPKPRKEKNKNEEEQKNFIKVNAHLAKKLKPPEFTPKFIDDRTGTVHQVENSGLEPVHIYSKGFGKPPYYVIDREQNTKRLTQIAKDKDKLKTFPKCRYITRPERQKLLNDLKLNWEAMQKEFQLLPIITDTTPKILKKSKMEKEIEALEKDIVLLEKHSYLYVLDED